MKKIVFVMPHVTGRGGTENVMRIVMKLLQQKGSLFTPKLYIFGGSESKHWLKGIHYSETVFSSNRRIRQIQNLFLIFPCILKFLKKEKPDIVIATHSITCFVLYWIRKITKGNYPIVSWIHYSLNAKNVKKELLHYADYHFAICNGIGKQFDNLNISNNNVYVVNNPVIPAKAIIDRPQNVTIFLYIGRIIFEGQKRIKDLLDALSKVSGDWRLEIIGDGDDLTLCKSYAEKLHINRKITWYGWMTNPWEKVNKVSALVMTSAFEGLPMVLAEGLSHGIFCISSNCETGPSDLIKQNVNGELYEPGNQQRLINCLQKVVDRRTLPDHNSIIASINDFYIEQYKKNFVSSLENILIDWKK